MNKQSDLQLELFSQLKNPLAKDSILNNSFKTRIWHYEKSILIIISIVITGIVSFTMGVERGKRLSKSTQKQQLQYRMEDSAKKIPLIEELKAPKDYKNSIWGYTIQLASYRTKTYAEKEAKELKKKGLLPLILSKGNYIVLCVGNFSNKQEAQLLLSELKKRYQGCFVRRL